MNIGDLVCRKSYNEDIRFIIKEFKENKVILRGLDYRLIADAELSDLVSLRTRNKTNDNDSSESPNIIMDDDLFSYNQDFKFSKYRSLSDDSLDIVSVNTSLASTSKCGLILHIDGDNSYLSECLTYYKKAGVAAMGINIAENRQPLMIYDLLNAFNPNIVVITGHDSLSKKSNLSMNLIDYTNSKYFVECVKIARKFNKNYDELAIIAGGCKSYYEALMEAGANFASSPSRVLINVTDPVYVACTLASTSIREFIGMEELSKTMLSLSGSIGGIETRGQCRRVQPTY